MSAIQTLAPRSMSPAASARPMPEAAPVTMAFLPFQKVSMLLCSEFPFPLFRRKYTDPRGLPENHSEIMQSQGDKTLPFEKSPPRMHITGRKTIRYAEAPKPHAQP
jgi:hypothetical protein